MVYESSILLCDDLDREYEINYYYDMYNDILDINNAVMLLSDKEINIDLNELDLYLDFKYVKNEIKNEIVGVI